MKYIRAIMALPGVIKILRNYAFIVDSFKKLKGIVDHAVKNKGVPRCEDAIVISAIIREAFERDLIDIPGVPEHEVIDNIKRIEANLVCSIDEDRKRKGLS